ncbi:hypothetical protein [Marinobacter sp. SS8-8]|uniref:hypothetical protein n=1 Tax=Marinobacter sp. SS8-8 TaxID=3050452 RepID=UPI0026E0F9E5|nr:hypothetical protein [Marinobacter sp. SS8-8]
MSCTEATVSEFEQSLNANRQERRSTAIAMGCYLLMVQRYPAEGFEPQGATGN